MATYEQMKVLSEATEPLPACNCGISKGLIGAHSESCAMLVAAYIQRGERLNRSLADRLAEPPEEP